MINEATKAIIISLDEKYPNAIPVFGGAIWIDGIDKLIAYLPNLIHNARFFKWHETSADACRRLCYICFTDPMLVELAIGMKFEELTRRIEK